jgi:hypothetical protein
MMRGQQFCCWDTSILIGTARLFGRPPAHRRSRPDEATSESAGDVTYNECYGLS